MATQATFKAFANLVKVLPTGTVFLFMFLNPVVTNEGHCHTNEKIYTIVLIFVCGVLCVFSCFTDSYREGNVTHYGIVTSSGRLWPHQVVSKDYTLKIGDFFHALSSLIVFGVLVVFDPYTKNCLYPSFEIKSFLNVKWLPLIAGGISTISALFPSKRHGIGYHFNSDSSDYSLFRGSNGDEKASYSCQFS